MEHPERCPYDIDGWCQENGWCNDRCVNIINKTGLSAFALITGKNTIRLYPDKSIAPSHFYHKRLPAYY